MSSREVITRLQSHFDSLAQTTPERKVEFWFARDLQIPFGYARWENFITAIMRAIESCKTTGCDPNDHFRGVTKMIRVGKGAERTVEDFMLTRYACYNNESQRITRKFAWRTGNNRRACSE